MDKHEINDDTRGGKQNKQFCLPAPPVYYFQLVSKSQGGDNDGVFSAHF